MTYQAPELLLVGAAQNLVLGIYDAKEGVYNRDAPGFPGYGPQPIESNAW